MYRRAAFYRLGLPVDLASILNKFRDTKTTRVTKDRNDPTQNIELEFHIFRDAHDTKNYELSCIIEFQERLNREVPYITVRDRLAFLFLSDRGILVVLGRERHANRAIVEMTQILFPDNVENLMVFHRTPLSKDAIIDIILRMREDDRRSWCSAYNAEHDNQMWNQEKTRTDFSLVEGRCVLDHPEAQAEIENATNISPHYKFYQCLQLTQDVYEAPKTMRFLGSKGVVSTSIPFGFECWYGFIVNFLLPNNLILGMV